LIIGNFRKMAIYCRNEVHNENPARNYSVNMSHIQYMYEIMTV